MAKAELKTKKNEASVEDFLNEIEDETIREDCKKIAEMMQKATKQSRKCGARALSVLANINTNTHRDAKAIGCESDFRRANKI